MPDDFTCSTCGKPLIGHMAKLKHDTDRDERRECFNLASRIDRNNKREEKAESQKSRTPSQSIRQRNRKKEQESEKKDAGLKSKESKKKNDTKVKQTGKKKKNGTGEPPI